MTVGRKMREQVLEEVRTELARYNPLDEARVPLELIAETSIRVTEADPGSDRPGTCRIIGETGERRTKVVGGQPVDFTIKDLVAEIRESHPTLFQSVETQPVVAPATGATARVSVPAAEGGVPAAHERARPVAPGEAKSATGPAKTRDVLMLADRGVARPEASSAENRGLLDARPELKKRVETKLHLLRG